jgi:hypothetical protein
MNFSTEWCGTGFNSRNPGMITQRNARCNSARDGVSGIADSSYEPLW